MEYGNHLVSCESGKAPYYVGEKDVTVFLANGSRLDSDKAFHNTACPFPCRAQQAPEFLCNQITAPLYFLAKVVFEVVLSFRRFHLR